MKITRLAQHQGREALLAPFFCSTVQAGFPSPADDYMDKRLDLNEHLIKHPSATFYCKVSGHSMKGVGIFDGDLLVVDRSLPPRQDDVVLAVIDGEMTCKILDVRNQRLVAANKRYAAIPIKDGTDFQVEGVVIHSIRTHRVCIG